MFRLITIIFLMPISGLAAKFEQPETILRNCFDYYKNSAFIAMAQCAHHAELLRFKRKYLAYLKYNSNDITKIDKEKSSIKTQPEYYDYPEENKSTQFDGQEPFRQTKPMQLRPSSKNAKQNQIGKIQNLSPRDVMGLYLRSIIKNKPIAKLSKMRIIGRVPEKTAIHIVAELDLVLESQEFKTIKTFSFVKKKKQWRMLILHDIDLLTKYMFN